MEAIAEHELVFAKAHRNGSGNESRTDMRAGELPFTTTATSDAEQREETVLPDFNSYGVRMTVPGNNKGD